MLRGGNIESATEALAAPPKSVKAKKDSVITVRGKKRALTALDGNIESAAEALAAPPKSVKATVTVKGLKRALEVASKSVKKGKITPGQKVKNGRNNKDINDIVKRVTRKRTQKIIVLQREMILPVTVKKNLFQEEL